MAEARTPLDLRTTAQLVAGYCRAESRGSEVVGAWVASVPEARPKVLLAGHAAHLAWRARLWRDLLPVLWDVDQVEPWGPGAGPSPTGGALAELAAPTERTGDDVTLDRLVGLYRFLLPRLLDAYAAHLERATEVADAHLVRALRQAWTDAETDRQAGEALLAGRLRGAARARAEARLAELEARAAQGGDIFR